MVQTRQNEKTLKTKKVALYCRVSTKDQSCERQEQDLVAFAMRSGFEVIGIFKETASGSKDSRPVRILLHDKPQRASTCFFALSVALF